MDFKRLAIPSFSPALLHTPPNGIINTESTTILDVDSEESSRNDWEAQGLSDPADRPTSFGNPALQKRPQHLNLPANPLLRTQPVKKLASPVQVHTHTKSYDVEGIKPLHYTSTNYMYEILVNSHRVQNHMNYYQPNYFENQEYQWEEEAQAYYLGQYYSPQQYSGEMGYFGGVGGEIKGVRRRNPEREEDKGKYMINLKNIIMRRDMRTTLMMKNIPNKYTQIMILKKIDENHKKQYDFFYLPIDFKVFS